MCTCSLRSIIWKMGQRSRPTSDLSHKQQAGVLFTTQAVRLAPTFHSSAQSINNKQISQQSSLYYRPDNPDLKVRTHANSVWKFPAHHKIMKKLEIAQIISSISLLNNPPLYPFHTGHQACYNHECIGSSQC